MKITKQILLISSLLLSCSLSAAEALSGTVTFSQKSPKGVLFIFAKKYGSKMPMPMAVKRIENPKFPVTFSLSAKDKMVAGMPFEGPFTIVARLSSSGDALDRSGPQIQTTKPIKLGSEKIILALPVKK